MPPPTTRNLDGLLAIGPHGLDAQLAALRDYAARTRSALDVLWVILPGERAVTDAPDSGFPIVAFDDEIAGFTPEEFGPWDAEEEAHIGAATDWHVAHATPQPKAPTAHLPVYGWAGDHETGADAVLCVDLEALDVQLARIEAYALRAGYCLRGVYIASGADHLRVLLNDFRSTKQALGTGPALTVSPSGAVQVHE